MRAGAAFMENTAGSKRCHQHGKGKIFDLIFHIIYALRFKKSPVHL
jgi:hypothetical protein